MNPFKWAVWSVVLATGLAAPVFVAGPASATPGFTCPEGSDSISVPYAYTPDNQPLLAGTVCVYTGTTTFRTLDVDSG
jgi:hypothetical protein